MDGLFSSPLVQAAIGLIGVWFVAALVCSGIVQLGSIALGFKGKQLWIGLGRMLGPEVASTARALEKAAMSAAPRRTIQDTALLFRRSKGMVKVAQGTSLEKFIGLLPGVDSANLKRVGSIDRNLAVDALVATATVGEGAARTVSPGFDTTQLGKVFDSLPSEVTRDAAQVRAWFERWFDGFMVQLSAAYRAKVRWITAAVGLVLVVVLHVNSLAIAQTLYLEPTARTLVVAEVDKLHQAGHPSTVGCDEPDLEEQTTCVQRYVAKLGDLHAAPGLGAWRRDHDYRAILGVLLSAGAVAAGAPFWFDVLRRLMGLKPKAPAPSPSG